ncbi:ScpA family protein [Streptomyces sp. NE5-10]|uniref:segregation and condensation protein A n=1 Tax=Streptomyces sp. NE5-10 TaxID=2759674 RepID=UPI0019075CFD|nr:ScpA family protein [Streptomyces sp. NE5-10]
MHPHADETSRPPRRRALGRGGGVSGAAQEPPTTAAPAPAPPTGPTRAPEPQPAPTEPAPTEPEPTEPESEPSAPRPVSEPAGGPGGVPASEGPEGVPGGVPASEGPEDVPGGVPASEGPEGVPGGVPASEAPEGAPGDASASGGGGAGGRFTVRLANFEGPFDLLLQLITKHKLDVTEVALSQVTDEFMAHLRGLGPDGDLDQTTEFLVVAATLLDLKTARLLPAAEVEDEADLALLEARDLLFARLLQYRAYKRIAEIFAERWEAEGRRHPRTVGLEPHHAELLPEVVLTIGAEGLAKLAVKAMRPRAAPQVYVDHIHAPLVSVREQAGIVAALLRERGTLDFRELVEDAAGDTLTVVARFLALLELYREKAVALDQEDALGRLTVSWTGGDGETRVTQEFDQEDPSA